MALRRAAISDGWLPKLRQTYRKVLDSQVREAAEAVAAGRQPTNPQAEERWQAELQEAKSKPVLMMALDGYRLGKAEFGKRHLGWAAKQVGELALELDPSDQIIARQLQGRLDAWITATSKMETQTTARLIDQVVKQAIEDGYTIKQTAEHLRTAGLARNVARSDLMARTASIWAYNEGAVLAYADEGITVKEWVVTIDDLTCDYCMEMDGMQVPVQESFAPAGTELQLEAASVTEFEMKNLKLPFAVDHPPLHPRCLAGETPVFAPDKVAGLVASYEGPVIELVLADGRRLAVTPNHMLLTPLGWVKAQSIHEGFYVICCPGSEGVVSADPDDDGQPATAQEVVESFAEAPGVTTARVPVSAEDLHGDAEFGQGHVDVVGPDGLLGKWPEAATPEQVDEFTFSGRGFGGQLSRHRDFVSMLRSLALAADRIMGSRRESFAFLHTHLLHPQLVGSGAAAEFDPSPTQPQGYHRPAGIEVAGELFHRLPALIQFYKQLDIYKNAVWMLRVDHVNLLSFSGQVYDFQTLSSLYIASGIVSSNCRCTTVPVIT